MQEKRKRGKEGKRERGKEGKRERGKEGKREWAGEDKGKEPPLLPSFPAFLHSCIP